MAKWKKIIVSGSDADLNNIKGSGLQLTNVPSSSTITTPLVIDSSGNVHTGSAYALASGGNTVGGQSLDSNIAIIGGGSSLIQTASSTQKVDFNSANLENINQISASNAIFDSISLSGSFDGTGSSANLFTVSFINTESAALTIPSTNLHAIDFKVPITMSNVPGGTDETKVLMVDANGRVVERASSDIGGVTQVNGGTNLSNGGDNNINNVTLNLDPNISLTSITASAGLFFSSSISKNYRIDYAKVLKANGFPEPTSGSLTISASNVRIDGDLTATGSVTLGGALSFNGFNFTETNVTTATGSTFFGSGSTGSAVQSTSHQFTGSVLITGSNLTLTDGILTIPNSDGTDTINVATALSNAGIASNLVTLTTFNSFSSSYSQSVVDFLTTSQSLANEVNTFESFSSSFSQSVVDFNTNLGIFNSFSQSYSQSVQDFLAASESFESSVASFTSFSSSFSSSIDNLTLGSASVASAIKIDGFNGVEFQQNVIIKGNLDVQGTTTTINTQDLSVEDRFIILGSGSAGMDDDLDVGIIFDSGSQDGSGMALYYDNSEDRLSVGRNVHNISHSTAEDGGDTAFNIGESSKGEVAGQVVTVKTAQSSPPSGSASSSFGEGEMYIDNNNDIYIYVE